MQGAREDIEILVNAPVKDGGTRIVRGFEILFGAVAEKEICR